jgi:hypothetical protein
MERLAKSCRRLVWLNPLLRYEGFEAKPAGIRAMLPYVDEFRPAHNLDALEGLTAALRGRAGPRRATPPAAASGAGSRVAPARSGPTPAAAMPATMPAARVLR